ncbi:hypothetical protein [Cohnella silvisoli]|uniref:Lipoprotein n=1 Tax=Cohnella silvisoli TaxID=2873699 RepID=A0ABV1KXR2_9BACL|nr:hypothetical protein [Cohnella silvisoli]MCD9021930.1 hypothetical protein [Cohnella silvisoli]
MKKSLIFAITLLSLFTACAANSNEGGAANSKGVLVSEGCPYNGAIVEVKYQHEIPFEEIKDIWSDNGWQIANPESDGHTIVGKISGSFEKSKWITTSAYKATEMTNILVWVNQEIDKNKHDEQVSKANSYMDKIESTLDKKYSTKDERTSKINWGCIQD